MRHIVGDGADPAAPREGWAPYLYIICIILLVAVDAFGNIKGAFVISIWGIVGWLGNQNRRAADGRPLY